MDIEKQKDLNGSLKIESYWIELKILHSII
jgi:hypothetical protein